MDGVIVVVFFMLQAEFSIGIGGLEIPLLIVLIECLVLLVLVEFWVFLGHFLDEILVESFLHVEEDGWG